MRKSICFIMLVTVIMLFSSFAYSEGPCTRDDITKAIDEATAILEQEGSTGLKKVGEIRFCGNNYLFVNDLKGNTLMHEKPHLIGKNLIALKDDTGKRFFADFTKIAKNSKATTAGKSYYNGSGWASYRWPKPGEEAFSPKISYIKACLMGDKNVYVGAGIYE